MKSVNTALDHQTTSIEQEARTLALAGFRPRYGELADAFPSEPVWRALRALGTRLWLDTGDLEEAQALWRREFSNLTTNNTLANREVQKGLFDDVIRQAGERLRAVAPEIAPEALIQEIGFVVNSRLGLRLVEAFDATVSVELHPGVAHDVAASVRYGQRYFAICPERFIVKVPLTPAGLLTTRQLSDKGIPVNFTLGFSARQNVLAAILGRPAYVNVFIGRLNAFVADQKLGDGQGVGEKAALATQRALRILPQAQRPLLIGASMRTAQQAVDLAGLDIFTMPTSVARDFASGAVDPDRLRDRTGDEVSVSLAPGYDPRTVGLPSLWDVEPKLGAVAERLSALDARSLTPEDVVIQLEEAGLNLFRRWSADERATIEAQGKIPRHTQWAQALASGQVVLDDLMTMAALQSFAADQRKLDGRIRELLGLQPEA